MKKTLTESLLILLSLIPLAYLAFIYKALPEQVPSHFNTEGIADDFTAKSHLWIMPALLPLFIYLLLAIIPNLDPKKRIAEMGSKYTVFRSLFLFSFVCISLYILNASKAGNMMHNAGVLIILIGMLLTFTGNYLQTVRPNYFIGVRTPWTLESEEVWKKTHLLSGKITLAGGILLMLSGFFIKDNNTLRNTVLSIVLTITFISLAASFYYWQQQKKSNS